MEEEKLLRLDIMGYHPAEHVPTYDFLAKQYSICDHWFASHPGATWPNRFITLTGRLAPGPDGQPQIYNPDPGSFDPLEVTTIFDHLEKAGVDWRYYEHDLCMLRLFSAYTDDHERVVSIDDPERGFYAAARRGRLPQVAFIDPNLTIPAPGNDDHAPSDIKRGQALVKKIYDALVEGPLEQWEKTLLIITYDEHGGFYDHVHPESKRIFDPREAERGGFVPLALDPYTGKPIDHYGMRVPTFVISPWVPPQSVSKEEYDHTTILKTIMACFLFENPPYMGPRVAVAPDLGPLLSLTLPRRPLNAPPVLEVERASGRAGLTASRDDFRFFMTSFRRRLRGE
jgi:phospholipase C